MPFGPGAEKTDGEAFDAVVSGAATWSEIDVPEMAQLIAEVRDVTRTDERQHGADSSASG
jgi:hypothetical protein